MIDRADIERLADDIARQFQVEKIILFGSHAYGTPHEHSDVDLLVVMHHGGRSFDTVTEIGRAVKHRFSRDILVIRPDELAKRYREFNPIAREALDRGVTLYDRRSVAVAG